MSPEAQRIAIGIDQGAKLWVNPTVIGPSHVWSLEYPSPSEIYAIEGIENWHVNLLPDYPNDLNAMHDAENRLLQDVSLWLRYSDELRRICDRTGGPACIAYHATAAQRAEAFLRTIGKWEESK